MHTIQKIYHDKSYLKADLLTYTPFKTLLHKKDWVIVKTNINKLGKISSINNNIATIRHWTMNDNSNRLTQCLECPLNTKNKRRCTFYIHTQYTKRIQVDSNKLL